MTDSSDRLHGLDAVRGYALMLGVVFHATMSFLPGPQVWMAKDSESSLVLSGLFFWSHSFRMTTFFLIAGFFAHLTFHRRGAKRFIVDRAKRIALPLVVFWPLVIAGILGASGYAVYVATGTFPTAPPEAPGATAATADVPFPLTHLWFLYVLILLYVATLAVRAIAAAVDRGGRLRAGLDTAVAVVVRNPFAPILLAVPVAIAFYRTPDWLVFFGVPTPDANLIPNPAAAVQYGLAFGLGWLIHRQPALLDGLRDRWTVNLAVGVALSGYLLFELGVAPVVTPDKDAVALATHAALYALAIWSWTFAVIGMALRFLNDESPVRRYIADSSYWIYVIHLPIVILLQAWVSGFDWHWSVKFAAVLGIGFAVMFLTYELLVRHTFIGAWLNGRRVPWRTARPPAQLETAR
ncbi:acyltransferase family protein [uncultured Phenylobacterium sp.]|uniref:acyltransferase family protein n=1 Tax=uncultured Phenylobacterium sp. TaxID=349273 RepID=UPI0025FF171B|nr:acyltransferase family protein [uncultured Phenylobacterium sp.]